MQEDIAGIKEDGESEVSTSAGEYIELYDPSCKIKLESGISIKTESVEEFYGEETPEEIREDVRQIFKKKILKIRAKNIDKDKVFYAKEMKDEDFQKYIVKIKEPIPLLKILTKNMFYQFLFVPNAGQKKAWKCWIRSRCSINICARHSKKKRAMSKVAIQDNFSGSSKKKGAKLKLAIKAFAQLFSVNHFPQS